MKHILRVIRSHGFWSVIISAFALCLAMVRFIWYNTYFVPGRILGEICFVALVLYIINTDQIGPDILCHVQYFARRAGMDAVSTVGRDCFVIVNAVV